MGDLGCAFEEGLFAIIIFAIKIWISLLKYDFRYKEVP